MPKATAVKLKVTDVIKGWEVIAVSESSRFSRDRTATCKCVVCGHLRTWGIYNITGNTTKAICQGCVKKAKFAERIGTKINLFTVVDVRTTDVKNTLCECVCGKADWREWGALKKAYSCGCTRRKYARKKRIQAKRKPKGPRTQALKMRATGGCRTNGLCDHYTVCGDKLFMCECLGPTGNSKTETFRGDVY